MIGLEEHLREEGREREGGAAVGAPFFCASFGRTLRWLATHAGGAKRRAATARQQTEIARDARKMTPAGRPPLARLPPHSPPPLLPLSLSLTCSMRTAHTESASPADTNTTTLRSSLAYASALTASYSGTYCSGKMIMVVWRDVRVCVEGEIKQGGRASGGERGRACRSISRAPLRLGLSGARAAFRTPLCPRQAHAD